MGYVPLFDNLTTGTLHGKWPDIGLWPVLLSMADRFGDIDVTPQYIAGVTGLDVDEVVACIDRFCSPDPDSRTHTAECDGRRLVPLEEGRKWGWHVVNHSRYREKARLLARDAQRTASGMDAERKRKARERPPLSPEFPPSDGDGDGNKYKNSEKEGEGAKAPPTAEFHPQLVPGLDVLAWGAWVSHRKAIKKPIRPHSMPAAAKQLAALGKDQMREVERAIAGGWQGLHPDDRKGNGKPRPTRYEELMARVESAPSPQAGVVTQFLLGGKA